MPDAFPGLDWPDDVASRAIRRLLLVLGDQLDRRWPGHFELDPDRDAIVMLEVRGEATHVTSHKARTALFLAAMRHYAVALADRHPELPLRYVTLDDDANTHSFVGELRRLARALDDVGGSVDTLLVVRPGEHRVVAALEDVADELGWSLEIAEDPRFLTTPAEFDEWADDRKELILEYFYRAQRRRLDLLMDGDEPAGGAWNYDSMNREALGDDGPEPPQRLRFEPDEITREVLDLVDETFPDAPGHLESFAWPVTREQALEALEGFLEHGLPRFGTYQDAMRRDEPWLWHSLLSPPLNLGLLDPREVVEAAIERYQPRADGDSDVPLHSVEGFVRQIIGWREFVRGVYWREGPDYETRNALDAREDLPWIYWSGETDMECMRQSLGQVLEHAYGHHIQRLMVTGLFALLLGVDPKKVSDWYLGMYVDGIDWVTLPNTLGMAMHADGGVVGTKPYAATGKYIRRMSDYCAACPFDPDRRTGDDACPFTTLYWDFLMRNRPALEGNRRMGFVWRNVDRIDDDEVVEIRERADWIRERLADDEPLAPPTLFD